MSDAWHYSHRALCCCILALSCLITALLSLSVFLFIHLSITPDVAVVQTTTYSTTQAIADRAREQFMRTESVLETFENKDGSYFINYLRGNNTASPAGWIIGDRIATGLGFLQ